MKIANDINMKDSRKYYGLRVSSKHFSIHPFVKCGSNPSPLSLRSIQDRFWILVCVCIVYIIGGTLYRWIQYKDKRLDN